jgi:chromosome segregation ATPase
MADYPTPRRSTVPILLTAIGACVFGAVGGTGIGLNISQEATRQTGYRQGVEDGKKAGELIGYAAGLTAGKVSARSELDAEYAERLERDIATTLDFRMKEHEQEERRLRSLNNQNLAKARADFKKELEVQEVRCEREVKRLEGLISDLRRESGKFAADNRVKDAKIKKLEAENAELNDRYNDNRAEHRDLNSEVHAAREEGRRTGHEAGRKQGYDEGYQVGYREGVKRGRRGKQGI